MTAIHENAYFLDSNIWIYALANNQDINKRNIACRLVDAEGVIISTQIINEVCLNLIKKSSFTEQQITQLIEAFYKGSHIISFNRDILLNSSNLRSRYNFSFWDSLIVACALAAGASILYSEDMQDGLVVDGQLQIVNPFK
ncbi:PIN domain-containing protein [Scytonema hofmannii FACHB-248]|uniref:PIN domain-containing protein n=1 Tax=Scytonema hofmannii FACHB-248 TaxID=1842502 RepID=A0ABR8GX42_9CYAN|nr:MULTISPECIES: PIN domain-containing protein [Nostocales]MBD2608111.1 PIN domain-containing protein [Scytonema hofmannii FACHB-248]